MPSLLRLALIDHFKCFYIQYSSASLCRGSDGLVADPLHTPVPCRIGHRLGFGVIAAMRPCRRRCKSRFAHQINGTTLNLRLKESVLGE